MVCQGLLSTHTLPIEIKGKEILVTDVREGVLDWRMVMI